MARDLIEFQPMPCDKIAQDLLEVKAFMLKNYWYAFEPDIARVLTIVAEAESLWRNGSQTSVETALELNGPYDSDLAEEGYLRSAKKLLGRRIGYKKQRKKDNERHGRDMPFAPFDKEQDE